MAAMFKGYKQLDNMKVLGKINPTTITSKGKQKALLEINLIKENGVAESRAERGQMVVHKGHTH